MKCTYFSLFILVLASARVHAQWPFPTNSPASEVIFGIASIGNYIFIGTNNGAYRTTDSGSHWQRCSNGLPDGSIYSLVTRSHTVFIVGDFGLYRSTDSGLTWTSVSEGLKIPEYFNAVLASNSNAVFFLHNLSQYLEISTDDGISWNLIDSNLTMAVEPQTMLTVDSSTYIAGSWIIATNSNGKYWRVVAAPPSDEFWDISSLANIGNVLFEVNDGQILRSTDSGTSWTPTSDESPYANSLATMGTQLFAYYYTSIYYSSDSGLTWEQPTDGLPPDFTVECLFSAGGVIFAGTDGLGMYRSLDSGKTWSTCNTGLNQNIADLGPILAYPNPSSGSISVMIPQFVGVGVLTLFSSDGRPLWKQNLTSEGKPVQFDLGPVANGSYWLGLTSGLSRTSAKVLLER